MATGTGSRNLRDGVLVIRDGATPKNVFQLALQMGNLTWTETVNVNPIMDRTKIDHVRSGPDAEVTFSFTAEYVELRGAQSRNTLYDFFHKAYQSTSRISVGAAGEDVNLFEMLWILRNPDTTQSAVLGNRDEYMSFNRCYAITWNISEADPVNTIAFSGRANITKPVIARS